MAFNFDERIDRRHSDSVKWNRYDESILPMWVADMDFRSPDCIISALQHRVAHGCFGYGSHPVELIDAAVEYLARDWQWHIQPEWLVVLPGVVTGLNVCVRAFTDSDGASLAPTPIYPPFRRAASLVNRAQINIPLRLHSGRYVLDLCTPETTAHNKPQLLMLCNPQNPGGTVYRQQELAEHLAFARHHDLIVCSDEIHAGIILEPGRHHVPFATLSEDAAQRSITLISPSKTYNIAGLGASLAVIPNPELRRRFNACKADIVPAPNVLAVTAAAAAWRDGEPWRQALITYLRHNRDRLCQAVNALPGLSMVSPEGTYLGWMDAGRLGVESPVRLFRDAGLGFSPGSDFGEPQHVRINFGCTTDLLEEAISRITAAVQQHA